MAVYLIAESRAKDAQAYARYQAAVPEVIARYGGRYVVRGGDVETVCGGWSPERLIILEFESREQLRRCFASPEYAKIAPLHDAGAEFRSVIVEGYTHQAG